jgi:hypothetical protein
MALPLGKMKAPTGWVAIAGRRGHYGFCDTVRVYDLQTGAAFIDDSCSSLQLIPNGRVDADATNRLRVQHTKVGSVSVDNLREAVWMLLVRGEARETQLRSSTYPLPAGVVPLFTAQRGGWSERMTGGWGNTGQTYLTWRWKPDTTAGLQGQVVWPMSADAAESHAASLLEIAEAGFVEGCTSRPIPSELELSAQEQTTPFERTLSESIERWRRLPPCRSGRP